MAFAPIFQRPFSATFDRRAAAAASWWLAGGAPTPVAVFQPKGAASLAASYVNLVNPGTYDAALGVAPTHASATGWTFNGTTQWLECPFVLNASCTMLVRFSDGVIGGASGHLLGTVDVTVDGTNEFLMFSGRDTNSTWRNSNNGIDNRSANQIVVAGGVTSGVMSIAGLGAYLNGVSQGAISGSGIGVVTTAVGIAARPGGAIKWAGKIQAVAIWDTSTGHATWMPAVSAAVALI